MLLGKVVSLLKSKVVSLQAAIRPVNLINIAAG